MVVRSLGEIEQRVGGREPVGLLALVPPIVVIYNSELKLVLSLLVAGRGATKRSLLSTG